MLCSRCAWKVCCWSLIVLMTVGCGETSRPTVSRPELADYQYLESAPSAKPAGNVAAQDDFVDLSLSPVPSGTAPQPSHLGIGPGKGGDKYAHVVESRFVTVQDEPRSTFSIDVDTASYSKTRMHLLQQHQLPPIDAVRIEELINYFDYDYELPTNGDPFAMHVELAECPWQSKHRLARVALKGREIETRRPDCNLVFLLDVSGSMDSAQKIGLVQQSMRLLTTQLVPRDRVSIVVYAGAAGLVLPATEGDRRQDILDAIDRLQAGGSTNGGAGIQLAYAEARRNLIAGGVNRVLLCTDGDFNVGTTSTGDLVRMAETESKAGVFLSVLGFGMGNHNDAMLEEISSKANGTYAFIDNEAEARKVFVDQINSTLVTIAKDVKIQIEFNPAHVAAYRLIGYENRRLAAHEFRDDKKDAGEVGAGHTITALYELVPPGADTVAAQPNVEPLKYQTNSAAAGVSSADASREVLTLRLRFMPCAEVNETISAERDTFKPARAVYKHPEASQSQELVQTAVAHDKPFSAASADFRFAASVAAFGMLLRKSELAGDTNYDAVLEIAGAARGADPRGYRAEFMKMVHEARRLTTGRHRSVTFR